MMGLRLFGHGRGAAGLGFVPPNCCLWSPRVRFAKMLSAAFANRCGAQHARGRFAAHHVSSIQTPSFRGSVRPAALGDVPPSEGAKRRLALVRIAAPVGRLAVGPVPSAEGNGRPRDAGRHAFRRLTAAFFLRPRDRLLETDRGASSAPLIPRGFPRVHPLPPARCRTDPCSWAGRCLPRPPEARLARPNPQAPGPFHHLDASRWRPHTNNEQ